MVCWGHVELVDLVGCWWNYVWVAVALVDCDVCFVGRWRCCCVEVGDLCRVGVDFVILVDHW